MKFLESIVLPVIVSALLALGLAAILSFPAHASGDQPLPTADPCVKSSPGTIAECIAAIDAIDQQKVKADAALDLEFHDTAKTVIERHGGQCAEIVAIYPINLPDRDYDALKVTCFEWPKIITYVVTIARSTPDITVTEISSKPAR